MTSIFDSSALAALRKELGLDPILIRGLRNRLLKQFLPDSVALGEFPEAQRLALHCLELERRCDSEVDGATASTVWIRRFAERSCRWPLGIRSRN